MLEYRVNLNKADKTLISFNVETISFTDFNEIDIDEETGQMYDDVNRDKVMLTCECSDIGNIKEGSIINVHSTLVLEYDTFDFNNSFQVSGVNTANRSFSIFTDKYYTLMPQMIVKNADVGIPDYFEGNTDYLRGIVLYFVNNHYFDETDNTTNAIDEETEEVEVIQEIPIYFRYNDNGETKQTVIKFKYYSYNTLITDINSFDDELYERIFNVQKGDTVETQIEGNLSGIEIYRENFLFSDRSILNFQYNRALLNIPVTLTNSFETNIYSSDALKQEYIKEEKAKAINSITDLEKDIYYPVIHTKIEERDIFKDIYTIKFNLHFREHRGDDWLVDGNSYWNGIKDNNGIKEIDTNITDDNVSDLLTFLSFTNKDVRFQKNKLKKSFLRLLFYDSTNPGDQNLIAYSTVFFDTADMFAKYAKHMETDNYASITFNKYLYGEYTVNPNEIKTGIKVNREISDGGKIIFEEDKRLSSQFIIKSKNTSKASSEGFYFYIWRDNESILPQDLYMKVEFNHAEFGRVIPFMMPYWDTQKHTDKEGIKTFQEILNDWNSQKIFISKTDPTETKNEEEFNNLDTSEKQNYYMGWIYNNNRTDGPYGIKQYNKYSYIHLKYQYSKENNKHVYYLDTNTYGNINFPTDSNGNGYIEINLYEAKVE